MVGTAEEVKSDNPQLFSTFSYFFSDLKMLKKKVIARTRMLVVIAIVSPILVAGTGYFLLFEIIGSLPPNLEDIVSTVKQSPIAVGRLETIEGLISLKKNLAELLMWFDIIAVESAVLLSMTYTFAVQGTLKDFRYILASLIVSFITITFLKYFIATLTGLNLAEYGVKVVQLPFIGGG